MELRHYLSLLWRRAWLLILAPLLAGAISLLVSSRIEPAYQASTTLLVSQISGPSLMDYSLLLTSERVAKTYAELLKKRPLLEPVISYLQLKLTTYQLAGKISVVQPSDTQLLELRVEDSDPQLAIDIANTLAAEFVQQSNERRSSGLSSYERMLAQQIAAVEHEIRELEAQIDEARKSGGSIFAEQDSIDTAGLEASLREAQITYANLLGTHLQLQAASGRSIYVEIVEPAAMPAILIRPRIVFNTVVAALAGLTLALGIVFLLEYLDDTLVAPEGAEQVLRIPTLAAIPSVNLSASSPARPFAAHRPLSAFAESYRALRTNVQFSSIDKAIKSLLITSASPGEGKTTALANLGAVMAQAGIKVLLVDTDLRGAALHLMFDLSNRRGLTDLLLEDAVPDESCLLETGIPNLRLLPSGPLPPTPSELISSERMRQLISHLTTLADVVMFDSPPALVVTDAALLASRVDGVLLVIESGRTRKQHAQKALHSLQSVGARVLGSVITRAKDERFGYYYSSQQGHLDGFVSRSLIARLAIRLQRAWLSKPFPGRRWIHPSSSNRFDEGRSKST